jgi:hypothetical protein
VALRSFGEPECRPSSDQFTKEMMRQEHIARAKPLFELREHGCEHVKPSTKFGTGSRAGHPLIYERDQLRQ